MQQKYVEGSDDEEEEDWEWVAQQKEKDMDKFQKETYFCLINENRKPMKKGSQAWNCYGSRNNEYLMTNYGFCFFDNLYTSYTFCVRLDVDFEKIETVELKHMIAPSGMRGNIQ